MIRWAGLPATWPIGMSPTSSSSRSWHEAYGFRPLFFWQPNIFMKAKLTPVEREEAQKYAWTEPAFRAVNEEIARFKRTAG